MLHTHLLCDELLELALAQRQAIAEGDMERLFRLMGQREGAMSRLMDSLPLVSGHPRAIALAIGPTTEIGAALNQLVQLDTEMSQALLQRMDELRHQLAEVRTMRLASGRYNPLPHSQQAQFFDHAV